MDCDLQDKPEAIPSLMQLTSEGYNIVVAKKINRQDTFPKKVLFSPFLVSIPNC